MDAGPLIALFWAKDPDHSQAVSGFQQLITARTRLITPVPILFEVYKWLLYRGSARIAWNALNKMQSSLYLVPSVEADLAELRGIIQSLSDWQGSLEDATVVLMAQRYRAPVWTLNYRDLGVFQSISFWNPI